MSTQSVMIWPMYYNLGSESFWMSPISCSMVTRGMKAKTLMIIIRMITAPKLQMMRWRTVLFFVCNSRSVTVTACPGEMSGSGLAVKFTAKDKRLPDVSQI